MNWPARWLLSVEAALNVYETLSAVSRAMANMDGERLNKWQSENRRAVEGALAIHRLRDAIEDGEQDVTNTN